MCSMIDICVVIVFYNGDIDFPKKVHRLSRAVGQVVVVDNGSKDEHTIVFDSINEQNIKVIINSTNMGIAYALNQGLDYATRHGFRYLLTMDQDSTIDADSIQKLLWAIDVEAGAVSVGPFYKEEKHSSDKNVTYLITSGNLSCVESLNRIGGYANELFIDSVDIDLSFNLLRNGYTMKKVANATMQHKIGDVHKGFFGLVPYYGHKSWRHFYMVRNNFYIYRKYFRDFPQLCIKLFCSMILELLRIVFVEKEKREKLSYSYKGFLQGIGVREWGNLH